MLILAKTFVLNKVFKLTMFILAETCIENLIFKVEMLILAKTFVKISDGFSKIMDFGVWATPWPRKGDPEDSTVPPWPPKGAQKPPRSTLEAKMTSKWSKF